MLDALVDLLPVTRNSIALPIPSYSLRVLEKHPPVIPSEILLSSRAKRGISLPEANGEWAMARYIEATEMNDPAEQAGVLDQIKAYNQEDLDATGAVLSWLRNRP